MKKFVLFFIAGLGLVLPFIVNAEVQKVWDKTMNFSNSLSASIIEVSDGIIVMQYEGRGSSNNLLKKYDFDGNKLWQRENKYGYNIESIGDNIFVWGGDSVYLLDKDGVFIKHRSVPSVNKVMVRFGEYYVFRSDARAAYYFIFDENGNIVDNDTINIVLASFSENHETILATNVDEFGNTSVFTSSGSNMLILRIFDNNNELVQKKEFSLSNDIGSYGFNKMEIFNDKYLLYGKVLFSYDNAKKTESLIDILAFDAEVIGDYLYTYEAVETKSYKYVYSTNFVKYDSNLNVISNEVLPLSLSSNVFSYDSTASSSVKFNRRVIMLSNSFGSVDVIVLNSPFILINESHTCPDCIDSVATLFTKDSDDIVYGLSRYTTSANSSDSSESSNDSDTNSDNQEVLIKNPDTSSMSVILFFVILIGSVIILSYSVFKKKRVNMMQ